MKLQYNNVNLEKYDITECLDILNFMNRNTPKELKKSSEEKKFIHLLKSRIDYLAQNS
ncbi:hypothetical protein [Adhaeribacter aquaticus]|uniref:hypothetical protein n=1 Tax=Adhaeribacter aquaticus TaxID=299567 RepID=UPI0004218FA7|nr:hypothetical protein [Adhaeribacter aquaticus]